MLARLPVVFVVCAAVAISADPPAQVTKSQTKKASSKRRASKSAKKPAPPARPRAQQQPTPERYKEIQQALADKGYFQGPVDGNWGPESVNALTKFQREQNLIEDGKISSLALIALGLGPRRVALPATPAPEAK